MLTAAQWQNIPLFVQAFTLTKYILICSRLYSNEIYLLLFEDFAVIKSTFIFWSPTAKKSYFHIVIVVVGVIVVVVVVVVVVNPAGNFTTSGGLEPTFYYLKALQ